MSEIMERPLDRPIVEDLAKSTRRTFDRTAAMLASALAQVAGDGATVTFDGDRFHLVRDGAELDVDEFLDAAVERISR
jgi:hypothetical protein